MQQNLESTEVVTQFTQIQKDLVKVKEIIPDEEKVLDIAHHPQQICGFCSFFLLFSMSFNIIARFIMVPFTPKIFKVSSIPYYLVWRAQRL